jgi:tetratricopeptide (TPR) repeat protein
MFIDPHAHDLAKELDGLPLALVTTGAYLRQVSTRLDVYLCHYRTSWSKLQMKSRRLLSYQDRTLHNTWNISLKHIENQNKSAGQLLRLLGYFDNHDIWYELLAAGSAGGPEWFSRIVEDKVNFNEVMKVLSDHSLIEYSTGSGGYSLHACVHAWIMHVLNAERHMSMSRISVCCVGLSVPQENVSRYWEIERRLLLHAQKCVEAVSGGNDNEPQDDENYLNGLRKLGDLSRHQDKMAESEICYHHALKKSEKALGAQHTSTLNTLNNLGNLYKLQGRMVEAEAMYQRALEGTVKTLGPEHTSTLNTVNNLGALYKDQGNMVEAEAMYQRALDGFEKALGLEHTSTLSTVHNLGNLYKAQGKMVEAEAMYQRALEGYEKALGPEHTSTLNTVGNLGVFYYDQGKMVEAEAMYQRALDDFEKVLGPDHTSTLNTVYNMGVLYKSRNERKEAIELFERVMNGYENSFGPDHKETFEAAAILADLYQEDGREKEAELIATRLLNAHK